MITDLNQLLAELAAGRLVEYRFPNVELKQSWSQDVGKKISSNANKIELPVAWVVVGVTDRGAVLPNTADWAKKTEEQISNHLNQFLDPIQACLGVTCSQLPQGWIIVLKVASPGAVVYWNRAAYKSASTTLAEMGPDEIMGLTVKLPGVHDYTAQKCTAPVHADTVKAFMSRVSKQRQSIPSLTCLEGLEPEVILSRLGIASTNASRLLFGNATFRVVFYDASGAPTLNDTRKPLYSALMNSFYEELEAQAIKTHRSTQRVFPPRAFQEAVANAVAHAAYFETDGELMFELFPDKLCISNLCTQESAYFANQWFSRSHKTVNIMLMETLRLAGHVDELGRGKNLILSEYLRSGCSSPTVHIEKAGRYSRWRLVLPTALSQESHLRLFDALRTHYKDDQKALIALALVLWRNRPVKDIRKYVNGESSELFSEVLADIRGATFYSEKLDQIVLNRWARLLLHEGVQSKAFSDLEEEHLYDLTYTLKTKYDSGHIRPKDIREYGELGDAKGAHSLSSKLLTKWTAENRVTKIKTGLYKFVPRTDTRDPVARAMELFSTPAGEKAPTTP